MAISAAEVLQTQGRLPVGWCIALALCINSHLFRLIIMSLKYDAKGFTYDYKKEELCTLFGYTPQDVSPFSSIVHTGHPAPSAASQCLHSCLISRAHKEYQNLSKDPENTTRSLRQRSASILWTFTAKPNAILWHLPDNKEHFAISRHSSSILTNKDSIYRKKYLGSWLSKLILIKCLPTSQHPGPTGATTPKLYHFLLFSISSSKQTKLSSSAYAFKPTLAQEYYKVFFKPKAYPQFILIQLIHTYI